MLKKLEILGRRLILWLVGGRRKQGSVPPPALPQNPRILLLRHDRIGDAIVSTPTVALLRERFPGAWIAMLFGEKNRSVAMLIQGIDERILLPTSPYAFISTMRSIRAARYDLVINLLAKESASGSVIVGLSRAKWSIGFEGKRGSLYHFMVAHSSTPTHMVSETSRLLSPLEVEPIGPSPVRPIERLAIEVSDREKANAVTTLRPLLDELSRPIVAINISGSGEEKFWGIENYCRLAERLRDSEIAVLFMGAPAHRERLSIIASQSGAKALPPTRSLGDFAALMGHVDIVLTPDTSTVHLSAALGKPTVVLTPSSEISITWAPWGVPARVVSGDGSIMSITIDRVHEAIIQLASETIFPTGSSSAS